MLAYTELYKNIDAGNLAGVKKCIEAGLDVEEWDYLDAKPQSRDNSYPQRKFSTILRAAYRGHEEIVTYLEQCLQQKYQSLSIFQRMLSIVTRRKLEDNYKTQDQWGYNFLHAAVASGNLNLVRKAIEELKFSPNDYFHEFIYDRCTQYTRIKQIRSIATPLEIAAAKGDLEIVSYLLDKGASFIQTVSVDTEDKRKKVTLQSGCPLSFAAAKNNVSMLSLLYNKGAPVDGFHQHKTVPILEAATHYSLEAATFLLERGANPDLIPGTKFESTHGTPIVRYEKPGTALYFAVLNQDIKMISLLLKNCAQLHHAYIRFTPYYWNDAYHDLPAPLTLAAPNESTMGSDDYIADLPITKTCIDVAAIYKEVNLLYTLVLGNRVFELDNSFLRFNSSGLIRDDAIDYYYREMGQPLLFFYTQLGLLEDVQNLLVHGIISGKDQKGRSFYCDVNGTDPDENTALHYACKYNDYDAQRGLYYANNNKKTTTTDSEDYWCQEHMKIISFLIHQGADVNARNKEGETPLLCMMKYEFYKRNGFRENILTTMLPHIYDVDVSDLQGNTALYYAYKYQNLKCVQKLLQAGANVNCRNTLNEPIFVSLIKNSTGGMNESLEKDILDEILPQVKNIDATDAKGYTALHYACMNGKQLIIKILLQYNANPNVVNDIHLTPFGAAVLLGFKEAAQLLAVNGAQVALLTDRGEDPLMLVANRNDEKMERWLVSLGVPIDTKNSADQTTFQIALQRKNHSLCTLMIVTRLLFLIANQQIPNPSIDALNFLFAFGGQTNQRDHQLRTLLHVAASCKNADFCEYLLHNQGADMDSRDIHGNTPSEAADAHGSYGNYQYDFSDIENNISEFFDLCASGNQLLEVTKLLEIYNPQLFLDWQKQAKENASTRGEKRPFPAPSEQNNPPDSSSSFFENQNNLKRQRLNTNVAVSATRSNSQQPN